MHVSWHAERIERLLKPVPGPPAEDAAGDGQREPPELPTQGKQHGEVWAIHLDLSVQRVPLQTGYDLAANRQAAAPVCACAMEGSGCQRQCRSDHRRGCRAVAAMFKLGDTVSYQERAHVVVGTDPMSVTPRLIEIEDIDSGRIRRVAPEKLQPLPAGAPQPVANRGSAAAKSDERRLQD